MSTLLTGLVDDAAVFPPGNASLHDAISAHRELRHGGYSEAIGPLLVRAGEVGDLVDRVYAGDDLAVGLIASADGGLVELAQARDVLLDLEDAAALVQVEIALPTDHEPAAAARALLHELAFSAQAYVEIPRVPGWEGALDVLAADGVERAKFRTGGTSAEAHPSEAELAAFISGCVERSLSFKLTAGLHHALRHRTAEGFEQHGLLNVLAAVAVALDGGKPADVEETLASRDAEELLEALDDADHASLRQSFVSFGCCGVTEPLDELADIGLTLDDEWCGSSWVEGADGSGFGIEHLPYGVFSLAGGSVGRGGPRCGVRIGGYVLDLAQAPGVPYAEPFDSPSLNAFLARGRTAWTEVRGAITALLTDPARRPAVEPHLHPLAAVTMHLPVAIGDYVDFYSSEHHALNVGAIFRPDSPALPAAWKHLPIGYHGRAGTVVVSGTDVVRPCGQRKAPDASAPTYGPSLRLDIEAEVAFVVGVPSVRGEPVAASGFLDHVFGLALLNDWSARDIQAWEYVPLGPFLGKSFATSLAAWVTPLDALVAARVPPPAQDPAVLPYLVDEDPWALDLALEVSVNGEVVSRPPFASMYWTPGQQLAHLTVNGASLRTGDLYASGTVSGPEVDQRGSFLELCWNGRRPLVLPSGRELRFLEDGDEVTLSATAPGPEGVRLTLAEVTGRILPALG